MSTNDVPGAKKANRDRLAMGAWAEHADGSLIVVESVEAGRVVYSIFDVSGDDPVEYRDAMSETPFKKQFSWKPGDDPADQWTWHDKTPFDWSRVMGDFPSGGRVPSAVATLTAAERIARSLDLRAEAVRPRVEESALLQRAASTIMRGLREAIDALRP